MFVAVVVGVVLLLIGVVSRPASDRPKLDWVNGYWIGPWLIGVPIISYLGSFQAGRDRWHIGHPPDWRQ